MSRYSTAALRARTPHGDFTTRDLAEALGIGMWDIHRPLRHLIEADAIIEVGTRRGQNNKGTAKVYRRTEPAQRLALRQQRRLHGWLQRLPYGWFTHWEAEEKLGCNSRTVGYRLTSLRSAGLIDRVGYNWYRTALGGAVTNPDGLRWTPHWPDDAATGEEDRDLA